MERHTREDLEKLEEKNLAPYAALSKESRGRVYPHMPHPLRTEFQRDRDRIVHSAAFRRMEYKTQVFIPHEADHYRTRLTHTIEVAQISRTLARILGLNEDLAEAIALVHDLGHTPFGHSGEDILAELLKDFGGFNHNRQSLRVVDILEQRYDEHPGLNLSYEVREGIVKHETKDKIDDDRFDMNEAPTLEASLVDIADEITYNAHDIDDGLSSGILDPEELKQLGFWKFLQMDGMLKKLTRENDRQRYAIIRRLLDFMVTDVSYETQQRLEQNKIKSLDDVRKFPKKLCSYSDITRVIVNDLKSFLSTHLYRHERMISMSEWAEEIITSIFDHLLNHPEDMPARFQEMLLTEEKKLVIGDYIAGMTDRFAVNKYEQFGDK